MIHPDYVPLAAPYKAPKEAPAPKLPIYIIDENKSPIANSFAIAQSLEYCQNRLNYCERVCFH